MTERGPHHDMTNWTEPTTGLCPECLRDVPPASEEARRLLEGNLGMLRNALQRHGLVVERLVVEPSPTAQGLDAPRAGDDARFDAGGRQSQGRQDAEQELERRTQGAAVPADATFDLPLRPAA